MTRARLEIPDARERDALATLVGRAVALDGSAVVRLRGVGDTVELFAATPFDALVTGAACGSASPADRTVVGSELLAALAVAGGASVDPGLAVDERWRGPVPAGTTWTAVGVVAASDLDAAARGAVADGRPSDAALDAPAVVVDGLRVPTRCALALSGAGLLDDLLARGGEVGVATGDGWLRLDTAAGAVVRRRLNPLSLRAL